jgi:uncharacterized protein YlxW (UPF0749 family)
LIPIKQGQAAIGLVCVVLGFMLAVQFRTTQDIRSTVPFERVEDLSRRLSQTEKERDMLLKQLNELKNDSRSQAAAKETELLKMGAGALAVHGNGIIVTLDDSKRMIKPGENPNLYLIHDDDILKVINELWAAGAEAISINGQRMIATTEIRCAGPTLSVNNTRFAPPYEIHAIGNEQTLVDALNMRGGVVEALRFWGIQVTIKPENDVVVPAYKGVYRFDYAKPIKEGAK